MTLRDAIESDIPTLLDLAAQDPNSPHWTTKHYTQLLDTGILRIGHDRNETVAFYAARPIAPDEYELENILVVAAHRRKGIADLLLLDLLSRAHTVHLEVRASNLPARTLYEKHGFRATTTRPRYYSDPVEDAVLYTCVTPCTSNRR